jgi:tetratricopeptide (TPR) repeat protein
MGKFFILISLLCHVFIYGENWRNYWIESSLMVKEKKYEAAELLIHKAIDILEQVKGEVPYAYIERAKIKIVLNKNGEAIVDLNRALSIEVLSLSDKANALILKYIACNALKMNEEAQNCWTQYKLFNPLPEYEETNEYLIIRNMPNCSYYRKLIVGYCLEMKICKDLSDIKMLDENTCVIKKTTDIFEDDLLDKKEYSKVKPAEEDCNGWCDYMAIAGDGWCGATFRTPSCIAACCMAVEFIKKKLCYRCCANGEFYKNCVKPFEKILDYIKEPCDPMWD